VLQEVQLLVGRGDHEVLPEDFGAVVVPAADIDARTTAERRICEHHAPPVTGVRDQGIPVIDQRIAADRAESVKEQVHRREPGGGRTDVDARDKPGSQVCALGRGEVGRVLRDIRMRGEQESARAAGWVDDPVIDRRLDELHHRLDEGTGGEVLARGRLGVPRAAF
jgi:hypothetical protein